MIAAAIDIGTNTVRLLIAKKSEHNTSWHDLVQELEIARLGEGVNETHLIKPEAMERTLAVLSRYKNIMGQFGVEKFRVVSTSAMRDAKNASDFVSLVKNQLGFDIDIISGEEEGRLTFAGATGPDSLVPLNELVLVVDVGGGSTEYIYGRSGQILGSVSLNIGSVRLTEIFLKHDPPTNHEMQSVRDMIKELAEPVFKRIKDARPSIIIAVAGTATQLAAIQYGAEPYDPSKIHGSKITLDELKTLTKKLASVPLEGRKKIKGMHPQRADVIVAGALILEETLLNLDFSELVVSEKDMLNGIIYTLDGWHSFK
ncbi:MAG: Ppx/GppA phosphatase family protein [Actinomycetota bacterium]